jgi:hypothetical protein
VAPVTPGVRQPVLMMVGGSLLAAVVAAYATGSADGAPHREIVYGMLAPLVVAVVSWVVVERAYRQSPRRVMGVMVVAFGAKMVVFGGYVAVGLRGLGLRPVPFIVSFTAYFIGLHFAEAWWLRRLFAGDAASVR